jgi:hypothetical protein
MTSLRVDGVRLLATSRQSHIDQAGVVFHHDSKTIVLVSYDTISDKLHRFITKEDGQHMQRVCLTGKAWPIFARFDNAPMLVDFR